MTKWQHCELWWQPHECSLWVFGQEQQRFPIADWQTVFARLGAEGWELVSTLADPSGAPQCWYYFKRPMES
jgi:hypothetical protein